MCQSPLCAKFCSDLQFEEFPCFLYWVPGCIPVPYPFTGARVRGSPAALEP